MFLPGSAGPPYQKNKKYYILITRSMAQGIQDKDEFKIFFLTLLYTLES
jgi:hypothetical protein